MRTHSTIARVCSVLILVVILALQSAGCGSSSGVSASPTLAPSTSTLLTTYQDYDALVSALGFDMVQIAGGGYVPTNYSIIDGRVGQIVYEKDDTELNLRMSKGGSGDIAGVAAETYRTADIYGHEVQIGSFRDIQVAVFAIGDYNYAMSATGMTPQFFEGLVTQIVDQMSAA